MINRRAIATAAMTIPTIAHVESLEDDDVDVFDDVVGGVVDTVGAETEVDASFICYIGKLSAVADGLTDDNEEKAAFIACEDTFVKGLATPCAQHIFV